MTPVWVTLAFLVGLSLGSALTVLVLVPEFGRKFGAQHCPPGGIE